MKQELACRRRRCGAPIARLILCATMLFGISASVAQAATTWWHADSIPARTHVKSNVTWYLTASQAYDYDYRYQVCAGAKTPSNSFYGSKICAIGEACHTYSGANNLYAAAWNYDYLFMYVSAHLYTNGTSPGQCPRGYYAYREHTSSLSPKQAATQRRQQSLIPALRHQRAKPRLAEVKPSGSAAFGDPDTNKVCLTAPDPTGDGEGIACNKTKAAAAGKLWMLLAPADDEQPANLVAAAPNGASSATVQTGDGQQIVEVRRGLIETQIGEDKAQVTWRGAGEGRSFEIK